MYLDRFFADLPSATEIVCALGLADRLVAVTHECDYPAGEIAALTRMVRPHVALITAIAPAHIERNAIYNRLAAESLGQPLNAYRRVHIDVPAGSRRRRASA